MKFFLYIGQCQFLSRCSFESLCKVQYVHYVVKAICTAMKRVNMSVVAHSARTDSSLIHEILFTPHYDGAALLFLGCPGCI